MPRGRAVAAKPATRPLRKPKPTTTSVKTKSKRVSSPIIHPAAPLSVHNRRSECLSPLRVAMDVAVARLHRFFRVMFVRVVLRRRGALTSRVASLLERDIRLRQCRIRAARRVLREAFAAFAAARRARVERQQRRRQERAAACVGAFLRAKAARAKCGERMRRKRNAAAHRIAAAWRRSPLFGRLQRLSVFGRAQRLLLRAEVVERREHWRRRWAFLVECHQRCYNGDVWRDFPTAGVRRIGSSQRVVMDGPHTHSTAGVGGDALAARCDGPIRRFSTGWMTRTDAVASPWAASRPALLDAHGTGGGSWDEMERSPLGTMSSGHRQCGSLRRADSPFLKLLQEECGGIDFATSMGARARAFGAAPGFGDGVVDSTDGWRVQDRWNAVDLTAQRHVWVGEVLLREKMLSVPLCQELLMQLQSRKTERQDKQRAFISSTSVDVVNARFLQPLSRQAGGGSGRWNGIATQDHTISPASMGREWAELYRSTHPSEDTKPVEDLRRASRATSKSCASCHALYKRIGGHFSFRRGERFSLQDLLASNEVKKWTQHPFGSITTSIGRETLVTVESTIPPSSHLLGSEFDVRYEIERLLVCEYHHRKRIEDDCGVVSAALVWLIRREQDAVTTKAAEEKKRRFRKGKTSVTKGSSSNLIQIGDKKESLCK